MVVRADAVDAGVLGELQGDHGKGGRRLAQPPGTGRRLGENAVGVAENGLCRQCVVVARHREGGSRRARGIGKGFEKACVGAVPGARRQQERGPAFHRLRGWRAEAGLREHPQHPFP